MDIIENRDIRKQFILTKTMANRLEMVAVLRHESQNEVVTKALNAYLSRYNSKLKKLEDEKNEM